MDVVACDAGAVAETVAFLVYFKDLPDFRQIAKVKYPLSEVLLLCLLAVIAGAETITDIARFGDKKLTLLRRFGLFREGTQRMITWVIYSPLWMPSTFNAASWLGSRL